MLEVVDHSAELFMASSVGEFKAQDVICLHVREKAMHSYLICGPYSVNIKLQRVFSGSHRIMELFRL